MGQRSGRAVSRASRQPPSSPEARAPWDGKGIEPGAGTRGTRAVEAWPSETAAAGNRNNGLRTRSVWRDHRMDARGGGGGAKPA